MAPAVVAPAPVTLTNAGISGTEPTVSVDPATGAIAVVSQHVPWPKMCSRSSVVISRDKGKTWSAPILPMGSGCQDIHAVVAWGPNSRLWFGDALGVSGGVKMAVSYSDNFGKSWAKFFTQPYTPAWVGCFPMMIVDNDPASPAYGTLYVDYNWQASRTTGPGLHIMAKPQNGPWTAVEVPAVGLAGYKAHNRIGYRLEPIAGGLIVAWYESDLRTFYPGSVLTDGSGSNIGRVGFATATLTWNAGKLTVGASVWARNVSHTESLLRDPRWQYQLAADYAAVPSGSDLRSQVNTYLAVSDGAGHILLGTQAVGAAWTWRTMAAGFHPVLAVERASATSPEVIFVGWHAGSPAHNYYTLSYDGGATWRPTAQVSSAWSIPGVINGAGLRENAVFANGVFVWAFGHGGSSSAVVTIAP